MKRVQSRPGVEAAVVIGVIVSVQSVALVRGISRPVIVVQSVVPVQTIISVRVFSGPVIAESLLRLNSRDVVFLDFGSVSGEETVFVGIYDFIEHIGTAQAQCPDFELVLLIRVA